MNIDTMSNIGAMTIGINVVAALMNLAIGDVERATFFLLLAIFVLIAESRVS